MAAKYSNAELIDYISECSTLNNDAKSQIVQILRENKKYGLVWEHNPEDAKEILRTKIPVFTEIKERFVPSVNPSAPNHILIEGENLHALHTLCYTHEGKFDLIYIDPPYNTGARDWKYNNDYVDSEDAYRHSKWLSMMEHRLKIAKHLLKVDTGIMIVAIDDYEMCRTVMLLEELFPYHDICPVIVNHHPQGGASDNISRTHEYAIYVIPKGKKLVKGEKSENVTEEWSLMRSGTDVRNLRIGRPKSFYAIYVNQHTLQITGVGKELAVDESYSMDDAPDGCFSVWPVSNGVERVWRYTRESMLEHIRSGDVICTPNHSLKVVKTREVKYSPIFSVWTDARYNAGINGTNLLSAMFGDNRFSYPKSLFTVYDCIKSVVQENKEAIILDFFAGSGTTMHATMRLNEEDGGHRRCFLVTNNENQICEEVTYPRNKKVIEGYYTQNGIFIEGLPNNTLRYFKVDLLNRSLDHQNKRKLALALSDTLCIKEDCYTEQNRFGALDLKDKRTLVRYFEETGKRVLMIYDSRVIPFVIKEIRQMDLLSNAIKVYVFSDGIYPYKEDFRQVIDKVDLVAMPGAFLNALKYLLPQQEEERLEVPDLTDEEILNMTGE